MQGSVGLRFLVLGPLEVRGDNVALALGGFQQRLLLAALLAHPNTVVSADTLSDILWGDALPEDASSTLAKSVYRLRSAFGSAGVSGILGTRSPGYLLTVAADQIDSNRFTSLLSEAQGLLDADPASALAKLDTALGMWRGPAWSEFGDYDFAGAEVTRLEGLRAAAVEDRADALLALGRTDELIPQLEAFAGEFPLRERTRAQLMLALYRGGRPADSLSAYRSFRKYLLDQVGLEPSPALQSLQQDILRGRADLTVTFRGRAHVTGVPDRDANVLTGADDLFVGRREELRWLREMLGQAVACAPAVLAVLSGGDGTGKTSLVRAFGRMAKLRGAEVIVVQCNQTAGLIDGALDGALSAIGASGLVLLVLDDLDADPHEARAVLARLGGVRLSNPLCVVATCGDHPEPFDLQGGLGIHHRRLVGLDRADVAEALRRFSGAARSPELVDSVCAETGGLPALVIGVGRRLRDLDVAQRADRALARAAEARQNWATARSEVTMAVLARSQLQQDRTDPAASAGTGPDPMTCPYKGLASFGIADAPFFSGRERLVAGLVAKLAVDRFVAVIGPSGSGKSSLVAAGLLPALGAGGLPGSEEWPRVLIRPGGEPMNALAAAIAPLVGKPVPVLQEDLNVNPGHLDVIAAEAVGSRGPGARLVLVVDQFEELFTACPDIAARYQFIRALIEGSAPNSRLAVAVVMRADYYGACAEHVELARVLSDCQVLVPAMTDLELRRAVLEPALRVGLTVQDGLADAVVADAAGQPGALPLVSTALLETWVRRSDATLTLAGYGAAGGVRGAVARLADGVYDRLDPEGKAIARRIFLRLADSESGTSDVRRRAQTKELASTEEEYAVLAELIDGRLLTATGDAVEVAHEALLREWPRLRGWLEEDREGRRLHRQLADAAVAWEADLRDDGGLYRGERLHAATEWAASHPGDPNMLDTEFLTASKTAQDRTLRAERRAARRLRSLATGLAALLVLAVLAGTLAGLQRSEARHQAALARGRALQADISRLAALARTLPQEQRDLALLLGAQGFQLQPSNESAGGLQAAVVQTPPGLDRIISYRSASSAPHLNHDGSLLAAAGTNGVTIHEVTTGKVVHTMPWPQPRESAVFSGDSTLVAAGGFDGQIAIWDAATGQLSGRSIHVEGDISDALFDPTNRNRLYVFTNAGQLTAWDRSDPEHPMQVGPAHGFFADAATGSATATISPDGRLLAAGEPVHGPVKVWDLKAGKEVTYDGAVGSFGADGVTLPIGIGEETILYNALTGERKGAIPSPGGALPGAVLSNDGRRIALTLQAHHALVVQVYDVASRGPIGAPVQLHGNLASPVGFLPDGRLVTSGSNEAAVWRIAQTLPPVAVPLPAVGGDTHSTVFMPRTQEVVTLGRLTKALLRHNAQTGETLGPMLSGLVESPMAPHPNGTLIAAKDAHRDEVGIWEVATGRRLAVLPEVASTARLDWSPDGRLLASDFGPAVQLWNTADPKRPRLVASILKPEGGVPHPDYLLFSPDGRRVLTAENEDRRLTVINVAAHRVQWQVKITDLSLAQVAFSPDGQTVAANSGDDGRGQLTLYDSASGAKRKALTIKSYGGLAYLRGGQWLVLTSGVSDPGAQLYDAATLEPIGIPFPIKNAFGMPVAANRTGTMFSESEPDTPLLWDADPAHWKATACRVARRNLSQAEWRQYLPSRGYQITCSQWPTGS